MPVGDGHQSGLDLLPDIRAARPELPVIVISAQNTLMTAVRANQGGAYEYVPKPFDLNVLLEYVEKSLARAGKSGDSEQREAQAERDAEHFIGTSAAIVNGTMFILGGMMISRPGMRIVLGLEAGLTPASLELAQFAARPLLIGLCIAFVIAMLMRETYPSKFAEPNMNLK